MTAGEPGGWWLFEIRRMSLASNGISRAEQNGNSFKPSLNHRFRWLNDTLLSAPPDAPCQCFPLILVSIFLQFLDLLFFEISIFSELKRVYRGYIAMSSLAISDISNHALERMAATLLLAD